MNGFQLKRIQRKIKKYEKSFLHFFVKKRQQLLLFSPVFFISLLLLVLLSLDKATVKRIDSLVIIPPPASPVAESFYPFISSVLGEQTQAASESTLLTAQGVLVMDKDSKVVLFSKNPQIQFSMASTTKIMTALTALEYFRLTDILDVKETFSEGAVVGLTIGEQMSFENLLYAMLLPSGNDAAIAIAQNYPGGQQAFVERMNEMAEGFYLTNTHFADPAGLEDEGDYTTVADLARLAAIAADNPVISKIVATKHIAISNPSGSKIYSLYNLNKLLGVNDIIGIKTGFTEEAEGVLVTEKIEQGHNLIIVVMKSKDRFFDTRLLLSLLSGNITYAKLE